MELEISLKNVKRVIVNKDQASVDLEVDAKTIEAVYHIFVGSQLDINPDSPIVFFLPNRGPLVLGEEEGTPVAEKLRDAANIRQAYKKLIDGGLQRLVLEAHSKGYSPSEIARELFVTDSLIYGIIRKAKKTDGTDG